jgi:hypothetical protein
MRPEEPDRMMRLSETKPVGDRVALWLTAAVVSGLYLAFLTLMGRSSVLVYSFALLALVAWPAVAPFAVRRLMKEQAYWPMFFSWGFYVLVLSYVIGHRLPFPRVVGYVNSHSWVLMGTFFALSVEAHHYLTGKRRKVRNSSPRENSAVTPTT